MNIRPAHIWWIGCFLFGLSLVLWITSFWIIGGLHAPVDDYGLKYVYIPFLAAVLGFLSALLALWLMWCSSLKANISAFVIYCTLCSTWAIVDIRCRHCQVLYCPVTANHSGPHEGYYTWWFFPQILVSSRTLHTGTAAEIVVRTSIALLVAATGLIWFRRRSAISHSA